MPLLFVLQTNFQQFVFETEDFKKYELLPGVLHAVPRDRHVGMSGLIYGLGELRKWLGHAG